MPRAPDGLLRGWWRAAFVRALGGSAHHWCPFECFGMVVQVVVITYARHVWGIRDAGRGASGNSEVLQDIDYRKHIQNRGTAQFSGELGFWLDLLLRHPPR